MFIEEASTHFYLEKVLLDGTQYPCQIDKVDVGVYKIYSGYDFSGNEILRLSTGDNLIAGKAYKNVSAFAGILAIESFCVATNKVATIRKKKCFGSGDDLGWLISLPEEQVNADVKFTTSETTEPTIERNLIKVKVSNDVAIEPFDYVVVDSKSYRVTNIFDENGICTFNCLEEDDQTYNFVISSTSSTHFDKTTLEYVTSEFSRNVSGVVFSGVKFPQWVKGKQSSSVIHIRKSDVGFTPSTGWFVSYNGVKKEVVSVDYVADSKIFVLEVQ